MALFSLFKDTRGDEAGVIFDIGSGHIGAALVVFPKHEKPTILWSTRVPMVFEQHIDFERFLNGMLTTLKGVAVELEKQGIATMRKKYGRKRIGEIICVFSSPWYISQTKIVALEKREPFVVTKEFIGEILTKAQRQFHRSAELQKVRKKLGDSVIIEKHIIQTALNGYHTDRPYGKMARSVHVSLFLSMISSVVAKRTRDVLEGIFNAREIAFHSSALTSFSVVRDIFHTEENFLLIDVGGEVTDVSLIREGVLHETVSFPSGVNFLFRTIVLDLTTTPEEAHSLVRLSLEKTGSGQDERLTRSLAGAESLWLKSLEHAFAELGDGLSLPRTVFMTVDSDIGAWFRGIVERNDFSPYTLIDEPFTVVTLGERKLYEYCAVAPGARRDPFLSLETLFLNKVLHSDEIVST